MSPTATNSNVSHRRRSVASIAAALVAGLALATPAAAQQQGVLCINNVVTTFNVALPASAAPLPFNVTLVGGGGGSGTKRGGGGGGGSTAITVGQNRFYAWGGDGANAMPDTVGGDGGRVTLAFTALPGDDIVVKVGGGGGGASAQTDYRPPGASGDVGAGGGGGAGAIGGGGGSDASAFGHGISGGGEADGPMQAGAAGDGATPGQPDVGGKGGSLNEQGGLPGNSNTGGSQWNMAAGGGAGYGSGGGQGGGDTMDNQGSPATRFYGGAGGSDAGDGVFAQDGLESPAQLGAASMAPTWTINPPAAAGQGAPMNSRGYSVLPSGYGGNAGYAVITYWSPDGSSCPYGGSVAPANASLAQQSAVAVDPPVANPEEDQIRAARRVAAYRALGAAQKQLAAAKFSRAQARNALLEAQQADANHPELGAKVHALEVEIAAIEGEIVPRLSKELVA
ncbi:hypothetical protein DFJ74DRAFT_652348 [Hyaloraphidium curvatum]|nr:hypothetical protein DFJ74DRAFT_652348 [Hyaloraphidium curvatum]